MKNSILILILIIISQLNINAQDWRGTHATVNEVPIEKLIEDREYVQIVGTSKFLSNQVKIQIDFGQVNKFWEFKDTSLLGIDGRPITLNGMVDALNFMHSYGYEYMDAYTLSIGNQSVYHYMLKRKSNWREILRENDNLSEE